MDSSRKLVLFTLFVCSAFAGCGGGGGGGGDKSTTPTTPVDSKLNWDVENWDEKDWV